MSRQCVSIKQEDTKEETEFVTVEIEPEIYTEINPELGRVKREPIWGQNENDGASVEPDINIELPGAVKDNGYNVTVEVVRVKEEVVVSEQEEEHASSDADEDETPDCVLGQKSLQKAQHDTRYEKFVKVIPGAQYKKYGCQLCEYRASRWATRQHTKSHVRRLTCPKCDQIIPDTKMLETHISELHPEIKQSKLTCEPCQIVFTNITKLKWHKKYVHSFFKCSICSELITKKTMVRHLRRFHENDLPTCELCGFKSTCKSKVTRHRRLVHFKEKNVTCDICNFQCFDVWDLKRHMICHEGKKLYECRFCEKKFARKTTCSLHEKIHTGEKNKVCTECGAAFVQKASLNYHIMKYHPIA